MRRSCASVAVASIAGGTTTLLVGADRRLVKDWVSRAGWTYAILGPWSGEQDAWQYD